MHRDPSHSVVGVCRRGGVGSGRRCTPHGIGRERCLNLSHRHWGHHCRIRSGCSGVRHLLRGPHRRAGGDGLQGKTHVPGARKIRRCTIGRRETSCRRCEAERSRWDRTRQCRLCAAVRTRGIMRRSVDVIRGRYRRRGGGSLLLLLLLRDIFLLAAIVFQSLLAHEIVLRTTVSTMM
jgi:hypothetical protein